MAASEESCYGHCSDAHRLGGIHAMTEDEWNQIIDPAIEFIRNNARESIDGECTTRAIQQKITEFQQESLQHANDPKFPVKDALLNYAKSPL